MATANPIKAVYDIGGNPIGFAEFTADNKIVFTQLGGVSTDASLGAGSPSNTLLSTQKAIKDYVDSAIAAALGGGGTFTYYLPVIDSYGGTHNLLTPSRLLPCIDSTGTPFTLNCVSAMPIIDAAGTPSTLTLPHL